MAAEFMGGIKTLIKEVGTHEQEPCTDHTGQATQGTTM